MGVSRAGRGGVFVSGLGLGAAVGVALGALVLAPNMSNISEETWAEHYGSAEAADGNIPPKATTQPEDEVSRRISEEHIVGKLEQRPVIILAEDRADSLAVERIGEAIQRASGIRAGAITLSPELLSPQTQAVISGLAKSQGIGDDAQSSAGDMLAATLLLDATAAEPLVTQSQRAAVLTALKQAGLIRYQDGTILPAQAVVYVTADAPADPDSQAYAIPMALKEHGAAVVVAGNDAHAGVISQVRVGEAGDVSTVDTVSADWSDEVIVLALAEQIGGRFGHYGLGDDADSVIPERVPQQHR